MNVVPDTSVVIDGRVSDRVESGEFDGATISVPEAVVAELEAQANEGQPIWGRPSSRATSSRARSPRPRG